MKSLADIAATLQAYDPHALSVPDVQRFLAALVTPVQETQTLALQAALGRVLAQDLISPIDVPAHDNAAMDGYAFDGALLAAASATAPLRLAVAGTVRAGAERTAMVGAAECLRIMTGAVMPEGLDTVVPQELVQCSRDADGVEYLHLPAGVVHPGDNRRLRGEDLARGTAALQKGELLTPARIGLAASLGLQTLPVLRPLRVAYFSTGDEILSPGEPPRAAAVYDSNRYTIGALLAQLGCSVTDLGVVRDDPQALQAAFCQAAQGADAIITSGGVSVGEADHTKTIMRRLGDVVFWRIAMRPGRPLAVGRILRSQMAASADPDFAARYETDSKQDAVLLFGLPGNPVAAMVTFLALVRPALLQMMGSLDAPAPLLQAQAAEAIRKKPGRTEYQRVRVWQDAQGRLQARSTGSQGSGVLRSMAQANGLLVLAHEQGDVAPGDTVQIMLL